MLWLYLGSDWSCAPRSKIQTTRLDRLDVNVPLIFCYLFFKQWLVNICNGRKKCINYWLSSPTLYTISGPVQVIQTQLLPIPVLPVQALPIQTLSPVMSPQGQFPSITPNHQQQLQPTNQTKVPQVNERESTQNPNQPVSGKSEQNPDPSVSVSGPKNNKGNKGPQEATFQTRTKPLNGQPTASSSVNKVDRKSVV